MTKNDFCMIYGKDALLVEGATGLIADLILAQSALETGWGEHVYGNNLFGIKAREGEPYFEKTTKEWEMGHMVSKVQRFASYTSPLVCMLKYCEKIRLHYDIAWSYRYNPLLYFDSLKYGRFGAYATDPNYTALCISVYKSLPKWREDND